MLFGYGKTAIYYFSSNTLISRRGCGIMLCVSGCSAVGSAGGLGPPGRRFEPCHSDHKRNVFCLPRQKTFFLAFWGKIQAKSHKMRQNGLREGHHGCPEARFFVSSTENSPKNVVYFLRFFALQRSRQSTARGDLNTNFSYAIYIILYRRLQIVASFFCKVSLQ